MALRMLEYSLAIRRKFHRFPEQIVLYAGSAPLRMKSRLATRGLAFDYKLVDIRDIDSEPLLASGRLEDNIIAVLTRVGTQQDEVQHILGRIATSEAEDGRQRWLN